VGSAKRAGIGARPFVRVLARSLDRNPGPACSRKGGSPLSVQIASRPVARCGINRVSVAPMATGWVWSIAPDDHSGHAQFFHADCFGNRIRGSAVLRRFGPVGSAWYRRLQCDMRQGQFSIRAANTSWPVRPAGHIKIPVRFPDPSRTCSTGRICAYIHRCHLIITAHKAHRHLCRQ